MTPFQSLILQSLQTFIKFLFWNCLQRQLIWHLSEEMPLCLPEAWNGCSLRIPYLKSLHTVSETPWGHEMSTFLEIPQIWECLQISNETSWRWDPSPNTKLIYFSYMPNVQAQRQFYTAISSSYLRCDPHYEIWYGIFHNWPQANTLKFFKFGAYFYFRFLDLRCLLYN